MDTAVASSVFSQRYFFKKKNTTESCQLETAIPGISWRGVAARGGGGVVAAIEGILKEARSLDREM